MQKTEFKAESTRNGWREMDMAGTQFMATVAANAGSTRFEHVGLYSKGGCRVIVTKDDRHGRGRLLWHLSISRTDRYPGWNEIKDARYSLLPQDMTFAMLLPPPDEYVNIHPNCFHLWEHDDT